MTITDLVDYLIDFLTNLIPLIIGLALIFFLWGLTKFILNTDSKTVAEQGKTIMKWGLITLTIMLSVWGFVAILQATFFTNNDLIEPVDVSPLIEE